MEKLFAMEVFMEKFKHIESEENVGIGKMGRFDFWDVKLQNL